MVSLDRAGISRLHAAGVLFALSSFLFALVVIAAPGLHDHLHSDAAQPQHECAITIVDSGTHLGDSSIQLAGPPDAAQSSPVAGLHSVWVAALFSGARIFEHAPPAFS